MQLQRVYPLYLPSESNLFGSQAILYLAEIGQKEELPPECLRNLAVVFRDHFTNTNVIANAMYALGAVAHTTMKVHTDLWNVMVKCVIAALRCHQDDQLVLSNGVYALGSMCTTSIGLRERVRAMQVVPCIFSVQPSSPMISGPHLAGCRVERCRDHRVLDGFA